MTLVECESAQHWPNLFLNFWQSLNFSRQNEGKMALAQVIKVENVEILRNHFGVHFVVKKKKIQNSHRNSLLNGSKPQLWVPLFAHDYFYRFTGVPVIRLRVPWRFHTHIPPPLAGQCPFLYSKQGVYIPYITLNHVPLLMHPPGVILRAPRIKEW